MAIAIVVNEVYYDPAGADGGYEFVELASSFASVDTLSLAGWRLETGNGASADDWEVAWVGAAGDRLDGGLLVIGESGVVPVPPVVADLDLQNGPDACRIVSPGGTVDVVGWGSPLPSGMFEGEPAPDVPSGWSLSRRPDASDTDHNAADFAATAPTPGRFNSPERLLAVASVEWPPTALPEGRAWLFRWHVKNRGRRSWSGSVRAICAVHPSETLARVVVELPLLPGKEETLEAWASPPPGTHLPRSDPEEPDGAPTSPAWSGGGEDVFVSEVLAAPEAGEPEWVELFLPVDLNLGAVELRDAAGTRAASTGSVAAGSFVVLTSDSSAFRRRWGGVAFVREASPWPTLNQTASAGEVAERLAVTIGEREVAVGVVPGHGERGVSWERIARSLPGDLVESWGASLDADGGTPGEPNSRHGDRAVDGKTGVLRVLPQPYRPGVDPAALIVVGGAEPRASCHIDIWDSAGRRVAELASWEDGGKHRAVWDGRRQDGSPAPLGLYVVRAREEGRRALRAPLVLVR